MATNENIVCITRPAGADLSAKQYFFVDLDTTAGGSQAVLQTTLGGNVIGVLQNKPTSGQAAQIAVSGVTKVIVGAAGCTAGDQLEVDAAGKATTATSTKKIVGRALSTGVTGDIISMLIQQGANVV